MKKSTQKSFWDDDILRGQLLTEKQNFGNTFQSTLFDKRQVNVVENNYLWETGCWRKSVTFRTLVHAPLQFPVIIGQLEREGVSNYEAFFGLSLKLQKTNFIQIQHLASKALPWYTLPVYFVEKFTCINSLSSD